MSQSGKVKAHVLNVRNVCESLNRCNKISSSHSHIKLKVTWCHSQLITESSLCCRGLQAALQHGVHTQELTNSSSERELKQVNYSLLVNVCNYT